MKNYNKNKKNLFITTPLYYANSELHVGHCYTTILGDVISKYQKEIGNNVFFISGADEHGKKVYSSAKKKKISPNDYTKMISSSFKKLWSQLDIKIDKFIRTSSLKHKKTAKQVFDYLKINNFLKRDFYEGYYCENCEEFKHNLKENEQLCDICKKKTSFLKEKNFFFKIKSLFMEKFKTIFNDNKNKISVIPNFFKKEITNFLKNAPTKISITRENSKWGVTINKNSKENLYVWFDALCGYLTALNYNPFFKSKKFWKYWESKNSVVIQIIGKEIIRFHLYFWPLLLLALGIKIPDKFIIHNWITFKEVKISKTNKDYFKFKADFLLKKYSSDCIRFFLMKMPLLKGKDFDFNINEITKENDNFLVNEYGNLYSRIIKLLGKKNSSLIPKIKKKEFGKDEIELLNKKNLTIKKFQNAMNTFKISEALMIVITLVREINKYLNFIEPWKNKKKFAVCMNLACNLLITIASLFSFFMPVSSKLIFDSFQIKKQKINFFQLTKKEILTTKKIFLKQTKLFIRTHDKNIRSNN